MRLVSRARPSREHAQVSGRRILSARIARIPRGEIIALLILLLGTSLRVYGLDTESLWIDEGTSIQLARSSLAQIIQNRSQSVNPPLYFILLHYWVRLAGTSEFSIRLLSVIFGSLALAVVYKLGEVFFDKKVGMLSCLLLATSVFHIQYSQEARGYSMMVLMTLLSMYFFIRLLQKVHLAFRIGYILSSSLLMYTHFYGLLIIMAQNVYVVTRNMFWKDRHQLDLKKWIPTQGALGILFIPWIGFLLAQVTGIQEGYWISTPTIRSVFETFLEYAARSGPLLLCFLMLSFLSVLTSERMADGRITSRLVDTNPWNLDASNAHKLYLLILWLALPIALPFLVSQISAPIYYARYTVAASVAFYILIARGIRNIDNTYIRSFIVVLITICSLFGIGEYYSKVNKQQWRELAEYLSKNARTGDLLLFNAGGIKDSAFAYYFNRADVIEKPIDLDTDPVTERSRSYRRTGIDGLEPTVKGHDRVWLILAHSNDRQGLIKSRLAELYDLSYAHKYVGIELYFFKQATPAQTQQLVTQEVRYRMAEAGEVFLVWGVNGWTLIPEAQQPVGTVVKDALMYTPMIREGDTFVARVQVAVDTTVDYVFKITETRSGAATEVWDTNDGRDYHTLAAQAGTVEVQAKLSLTQDQAPMSANGAQLPLLIGLSVVFIIGALFIVSRYPATIGVKGSPTSRQFTYLRDLLRELVARDMKLRYKRSVLGIAWSLLNPLFQMLVFTFLSRRVFSLEIPNYPSFVFTGLLAWNWFQSTLLLATTAITGSRELLRRPGFPVAILPVATVTTNLIHFLLALPVLLLFLVLGGGRLTIAILILPFVIVLQFLLTLGLSYLAATFQVTFRDTQHILTVAFMLLFYLTPVFYDAGSVPARYQTLYRLNPMLHLITAYRAILIQGALPDLSGLLVVGLLGGVLLWIGHTVFTRASYRFVEEL